METIRLSCSTLLESRVIASHKLHILTYPTCIWPMSIVAKRLDVPRCHLERGYRPQPRPHCVRWGPSSTKRGTAAPSFQRMSMAKRSPISATADLLYKVTTNGVFDHATYRSHQKQAKTLRHMGWDSSALGARQFGT